MEKYAVGQSCSPNLRRHAWWIGGMAIILGLGDYKSR
jgi:hypothetical protein